MLKDVGEGAELKLYPSVTGLVSAAWAECTSPRKDRKSEGKLQRDYDRITQQRDEGGEKNRWVSFLWSVRDVAC